ncbi:MAG: hypothetical protein J07HR59_01148 [Halorubrum sp. J07HR59]|nr:MAG: hypothetical protein J07HR59_01148 [Halorubrum sp. J07HR59]
MPIRSAYSNPARSSATITVSATVRVNFATRMKIRVKIKPLHRKCGLAVKSGFHGSQPNYSERCAERGDRSVLTATAGSAAEVDGE